MAVRSALASILDALERYYGPVAPPPAQGPFELILWENVAYLASDERREEAFRALKKKVGTTADRILAADASVLRQVAELAGILPAQNVGKLLRVADIASLNFGGDLRAVLELPEKQASKALRQFPGIGAPGAEKILLFCGKAPVLALESNGLRVLVRLGYGEEKKSYTATYRLVREAARRELKAEVKTLQRAHLLLRRHGQELCRRSVPRCPECPVAGSCAFARSSLRGRTSSGRRSG